MALTWVSVLGVGMLSNGGTLGLDRRLKIGVKAYIAHIMAKSGTPLYVFKTRWGTLIRKGEASINTSVKERIGLEITLIAMGWEGANLLYIIEGPDFHL